MRAGELIWISDHWTTAQGEMRIAWKELYAITIAVNTWGTLWQRKILTHSDNQTVVSVWEKGPCKSPEIMALILVTTLMFVSNTFPVSRIILQMPFLVFITTDSEIWHQMPTYNPTSSLLGLSKPSPPPPAIQISWCRPINSAHIPIWDKCLLIVLLSL